MFPMARLTESPNALLVVLKHLSRRAHDNNLKNVMADASSIDNSSLISLIEKYPVLWDKTTAFYKNRAATQASWKLVVKSLNPESMVWDDVTRKAYDKLIKQRWTHIRDNYYRSYRKLQEQQMTGTRPTKPYIYSKRLAFLRKIMPGNESVSSEVDIKTENQESDSESIDVSENSLEDNDIGTIHSTLEYLPSRPSHDDNADPPISTQEPLETNRHLLFFKGVLPSLASFDDNETIDFQMGVLQLLKKIKSSRQSQQLPSYIKYEDTSNNHDGYSS